jgi:hypothetical protein
MKYGKQPWDLKKGMSIYRESGDFCEKSLFSAIKKKILIIAIL